MCELWNAEPSLDNAPRHDYELQHRTLALVHNTPGKDQSDSVNNARVPGKRKLLTAVLVEPNSNDDFRQSVAQY